MQALVTSGAYAMGGEEASEGWNDLMGALTTEEDEAAMVEAREAELRERVAEDRRQRMAEMRQQGSQSAGIWKPPTDIAE